MYELINRNIGELIRTVDQKGDLAPYLWMIEELPRRDVANDEEFQKKYCSYWALNGAGLNQAFRAQYFSLLEREKRSGDKVNVKQIAQILYETPVNSKEKRALQFSFATKLAHMVSTRTPVYDRMVESFYFLPRSYAGKPETKLENLLRSYEFLIREYDRVLRDGLLLEASNTFRAHFRLPLHYSDQKIIDTLIWKFIPFLQGGALRNGSVMFR